MKTNTLARIYAFAISMLFATAATVGIAVLMDVSGEQARTSLSASSAPADNSAVAPSRALTQRNAPAPTKQQL